MQMPIPNPKDGEKEEEYISRCMSNDTMKEEYKEKKQRLAVSYSQFRKKQKESGRIIVAENVPLILGASIEVSE